MTYLVIQSAVSVIGLAVIVAVFLQRDKSMRREAYAERSELLNRIQHPHLIPIPPPVAANKSLPDGMDTPTMEEEDPLGQVGKVFVGGND